MHFNQIQVQVRPNLAATNCWLGLVCNFGTSSNRWSELGSQQKTRMISLRMKISSDNFRMVVAVLLPFFLRLFISTRHFWWLHAFCSDTCDSRSAFFFGGVLNIVIISTITPLNQDDEAWLHVARSNFVGNLLAARGEHFPFHLCIYPINHWN